MAQPDMGLADAVDAFIGEVGDALEPIAESTLERSVDDLRHDLALDAFNLSAAFIDCDDSYSDTELLAFTVALERHFPDLLPSGTSPADVRSSGLITGKRSWLAEPSGLFNSLVRADHATGTAYSSVYYEHALRVAHTAISLDDYTSRFELSGVEKFRSMLLRIMKTGGVNSGASVATTGGPGPKPSSVPTEAELGEPRPLDDLLEELDELIGLDEVKEEVKLVAALLKVQQLRAERDLPVIDSSRHLIFVGNPGTGKTTVARLLAQIYRTLGVVERGHLVETDRSGLVAGFVGQTAMKVVEVFDRADEGVLLIDEAYSLTRGGERDFGREAIDAVVKLVEDRRDRIVAILAGYPDEMRALVEANPGMASRFPRTISFSDYSDTQLLQIFELIAGGQEYHLDESGREAVIAWFAARSRTRGFGNGRAARNLFEASVARHATRMVTMSDHSNEDLMTLTADDIGRPAAEESLDDASSPDP